MPIMSSTIFDLLEKNRLDQMERELISHPGIINDSSTNRGETLLMAACIAKNKTAVRILLTLGANPNVKCSGHNGETPIYKTCTLSSINNLAIARMLIDNGARLDVKTEHDKYTPLHQACFCGRSAIAILLIENGANCNAMNHYNETPLHIALRYGHVTKEVSLLMAKTGGDLYGPLDVRGKRPIDYVMPINREEFTSVSPVTSSRRADSTPVKSTSTTIIQHPYTSRQRSSSVNSTPEKMPPSRTPPASSDPDFVMDVIPVRSYSRSVMYKANGQSTPMKHSSLAQSPLKIPQPSSRVRSPPSSSHRSPLVFGTQLGRSPAVSTSASPLPLRSASPPPSSQALDCPETPSRDRTPRHEPTPPQEVQHTSLFSPTAAFSALSALQSARTMNDSLFQSQSLAEEPPSSRASRTPAKRCTPSRPTPPAPPNTPSITQFFTAVVGKAIPKDVVLPKARNTAAQALPTRKRKSRGPSVTEPSLGAEGHRKKITNQVHPSSDKGDSLRTSRGRASHSRRNSVYSSSGSDSGSSGDEEEVGYTDISLADLPEGAAQYLRYLGMRFLDTDDHVVFLVHSICTHPDYEGLMFKYFVVSANEEVAPPENDDDFEYSMCEEMVSNGTWAQWLTQDEDAEGAALMNE